MTFQELYQQALRLCDSPTDGTGYYSLAEAKFAVNSAQRIFCLLALSLEKTGTLTLGTPEIAGTSFYRVFPTLPRFLLPLRVLSGSTRVDPITMEKLQARNSRWMEGTGTPTHYGLLGLDRLVFFPRPTSGTVSVLYAAMPDELVADGDIPEVREEYHGRLGEGAAAILRLKEGGQELKKAEEYWLSFLKMCREDAQLNRVRSVALRYDTQPAESWFRLIEEDRWPWLSTKS